MVNSELFDRSRNVKVYSEEDIKNKLIIPLLEDKGYDVQKDMRFENPIAVQIGSKKTTVKSDIEIMIDGKTAIVIDTKNPRRTLQNKDLLQASSYGKLISTPAAMYSFATNGYDLLGCDNIFGNEVSEIPSKGELIAKLQQVTPKKLTEVELQEVKSTLITVVNINDLYEVIKECKKIIENRALIRSDQSFKEMTKIMLVKMNEERRARIEQRQNRFNYNYLNKSAEINKTTELNIFRKLFEEAVTKYKGIYRKDDPGILIQDNESLVDVVKLLEPYTLLGTGDDIKGAVYEIFLKANLRGDFDQYFTPRQIVEFMVQLGDPKVGENFVDPAAGSGGFLVAAFQNVNKKLKNMSLSPTDYEKKEKELTDIHIWGQEADYDLHVLTKINMIMHGDGWNNIYQGDSLRTNYLPEGNFDLVLENPPFTIKYKDKSVLANYELGVERSSQELDILFVEKSIRLLKAGGRMLIIIPEGMLNLKKYAYFRKWLLDKVWILSTISLPAGTFQPFGESASKTAVLEVRKKGKEVNPPKYIFAANVGAIGYDTGKKIYRETDINDLPWVIEQSKKYSSTLQISPYKSSSSIWRSYKEVDSHRIDAGVYLSELQNKQDDLNLGELFEVDNDFEALLPSKHYNYVQVPYFSEQNGVLLKNDRLAGRDITSKRLNKINPGEIYFTRINPRKRRIGVVPSVLNEPIYVSGEVYRLKWKDNKFLSKSSQYAILPLLRSKKVTDQVISLATGSSSSRARISDSSLEKVILPKEYFEKGNKLDQVSDEVLKETNEVFEILGKLDQIMNN